MADDLNDSTLADLRRARPDVGSLPAADGPEGQRTLAAVLRGAHARARRRKLVTVGAAAALVLGVVLGIGATRHATPTVPGATHLDLQTIAYKTQHATAHAEGQYVEYVQQTFGGVVTTPQIGSVAMWSDSSGWRTEMLDESGNPLLDISRQLDASGQFTRTIVNYKTQQYGEFTGATPPLFQAFMNDVAGADVAQQIQTDLANGTLTEVGQTTLNGQPALELQGSAPRMSPIEAIPFAGAALLAKVAGTPVATPALDAATYTLWVDPTTYLPMQRTVTTPYGTVTATIQWLPDNAANEALISAPIPTGFTQSDLVNTAVRAWSAAG